MSSEFLESDIEEIIARHPEIIEKSLTLKGRQVGFRGKRVDLLFTDKLGYTLVVELKKGFVKREDVGQLVEYNGLVNASGEERVRVMLVGSTIPINLQRGMDGHGIEYRELKDYDYIEFMRKNDATLSEKIKRKQPSLPTAPVPKPTMKQIETIETKPLGEPKYWIFQTSLKHFEIFRWWDDIQSKFDFWLINRQFREQVWKLSKDAILVTLFDHHDIWAIDKKSHDRIKNAGFGATPKSEKYDYWEVKKYPEKIKKGDMVAAWVAKGDSREDIRGIYAIAEVITDPYDTLPPPTERGFKNYFKEPIAPNLEVGINYVEGPQKNPRSAILGIAAIEKDPILSQLVIMRMPLGTNFPVTPQQWQRIMERVETHSEKLKP